MESNLEPEEWDDDDDLYVDEEDEDGTYLANGGRKPRRDALQGRLTDDQGKQMEIWLREEGRGYKEVRELMKAEFGVETSEAALCRYYQRWLAPLVVSQAVTRSVKLWGKKFPSQSLETVVIARARQMSYSEMLKQEPDVRAVRRLMALVDVMERRDIARERLALERQRFEAGERRKGKPKSPAEWMILERTYLEAKRQLDLGEPIEKVLGDLGFGKQAAAGAAAEAPTTKIQAPGKRQRTEESGSREGGREDAEGVARSEAGCTKADASITGEVKPGSPARVEPWQASAPPAAESEEGKAAGDAREAIGRSDTEIRPDRRPAHEGDSTYSA